MGPDGGSQLLQKTNKKMTTYYKNNNNEWIPSPVSSNNMLDPLLLHFFNTLCYQTDGCSNDMASLSWHLLTQDVDPLVLRRMTKSIYTWLTQRPCVSTPTRINIINWIHAFPLRMQTDTISTPYTFNSHQDVLKWLKSFPIQPESIDQITIMDCSAYMLRMNMFYLRCPLLRTMNRV